MLLVHEDSLLEAVEQSQLARALELLNSGADPNERDAHYGWTPLHICARDGKLGLAKLLIKRGASLESRDAVGQTPLHRAAFWGHLDMVRFFLDQKADFTALDDLLQTPEELARIQGHEKVFDIIQKCVIFLELGGFDYPPKQLELMKSQFRKKLEVDRKRREMKDELERQGLKAEKEREKLKAKELKLLEKKIELDQKLAALRQEATLLLSRPHEELTKKEVSLLKQLQLKVRKLEANLETQKLKLNKKRRRSLQNLPTEHKGIAWIAFINEA